jgi:hypothetical protein
VNSIHVRWCFNAIILQIGVRFYHMFIIGLRSITENERQGICKDAFTMFNILYSPVPS